MPRKHILSAEEKARCRAVKRLRVALHIPATNFAALVGLSLAKLVNREQEVTPWQAEEITTVRTRLSEIVTRSAEALAALGN